MDDTDDAFGVFLRRHKLDAYQEAFEAEGFDDLAVFVEMDETELEELMESANMKRGHRKKLPILLREEKRKRREEDLRREEQKQDEQERRRRQKEDEEEERKQQKEDKADERERRKKKKKKEEEQEDGKQLARMNTLNAMPHIPFTFSMPAGKSYFAFLSR